MNDTLKEGYSLLEDYSLAEAFKEIEILDEWKKEGSITCTDAFTICPTYRVVVGFEDAKHKLYTGLPVYEDDLKSHLLAISKTKSCRDFGVYLYNLILYAKQH